MLDKESTIGVNNLFERTYTIEDIQKILKIGRNTAYCLVKEKNFKTIKVGKSIRISKKSFDEWLDG